MSDGLPATASEPPIPVSPRGRVLAALALIALAAVAVYANAFRVPFLFDDRAAVTDNASIRNLRDLGTVLSPAGLTTGGRPLVNLTLALNYAWTGNAVWSYHAVNLAFHLCAALVLFGVLRRTLATLPAGGVHRDALPLALFAALLWTVHPLQTCVVTYVSQRAESLLAVCYLLTLYGLIRSAASSRPALWRGLSLLACCAGMATKEGMVTAPVLVLLYDRVFLSGSFGAALSRRRWFYAGLAASWLLLGYFMVSSRLNQRVLGVTEASNWLPYALTESQVVVRYFKLALWPDRLVFDYGREVMVHDLAPVLPYVVLVLTGLAGTVLLFVRGRTGPAFLAAAFFILLAPTSSVVPIVEQPMAENRMYLPLAAVIMLAVLGLHRALAGRIGYALGSLALLLGGLTLARNHDYRSAAALWEDTVAKRPENSRAHYNLGIELGKIPGRQQEAITQYEEALRTWPDSADAHNNLANLLADLPGRTTEAIFHYGQALRDRPGNAEAHNNLATVLAGIPGRLPEAISHLREALRLKPGFADAHNNLANYLARDPGGLAEALAHYVEALRLKPDFPAAHFNYANKLAALPGRLPEALGHYEEALRLDPGDARVRNFYALALAQSGQPDRAVLQLTEALKLDPGYAEARANLEKIRAGKPP